MHALFPAIKPYAQHKLAVDASHVIYVEETGSASGMPVIVVHSGPGGGGDVYGRRFFDPQRYRIILFDQRGCGRSVPHATVQNNTTQDLIDDIEAIRAYLQLDRFVLFGGGWGALLALLYAQTYPHYVKALLLYQIFLGRQADIQWFYQYGASQIYPDYWSEFTDLVINYSSDTVPAGYLQCLRGDNELVRMSAAKNWALWRARCSSMQPHSMIMDQHADPHFALALATLESHYVAHNYFIKENQVVDNAHKIRHIPCYMVHGRYDIIYPLMGAWELHQVLPSSSLRIVRDAGHSDREKSMIDALIQLGKTLIHNDLDAG